MSGVEIRHSIAAIDAWSNNEERLKPLLVLALQLSGCHMGYVAIQVGPKLLVGAREGAVPSKLPLAGSFYEALQTNVTVSDVLHLTGDGLMGFRQNPLLSNHPQLDHVWVFPLSNKQGSMIGCFVMANEGHVELSAEQTSSCKVIAKQFGLELEFCQKVGDLKASQAQLLQMNTELRRFASVAAHDLRSPLRAMGSFAGLLRRRLKQKLSAEELEYVDHIRSGATRLSAMVEGILNLAKANHEDFSNYENIDLPTLVAEVADLIDPDQHHIIDFEGDHRRIRSSPSAIKQVLMNLVSNAVKYHHLPAGRIIVTASSDELNYTIQVTDNGPGIAAEDQERIFEAFVTGAEAPRVPGTGLGLALVRSLVNRRGGSLSLESALGQGSTFEVKIPSKPN